MKKLYCTLIFLILALWAHSQVSTSNYILTRTMRDSSGVSAIDRIQYYDGLGRPYLAVSKGAAGGGRHLASLQEYDDQGRSKNVWLPVCIEQEYHYSYELKKKLREAYQDSLAYSSYGYLTLPLDRVTSECGPGTAWAGKGITNDYSFNTDSPGSVLSCRKYSAADGGGGLVSDGYYKANSLSVACTTDEDGCRSYTFKDSEGRVLLVRLQEGDVFSDTYSVYDSFGRLCYVLPPSYQENADLNLWAYQYAYDGLGRCIRKKYPGCGEVCYVYDNADRVIRSEDGVQRSRSRYTSYAYDAFGRLASTSEMTHASGGGQDVVNSRLLNHYDSYDFLDAPELSAIKDSLCYRALSGFGVRYINVDTPSASSQGMLTGTSVDGDISGESGTRLYAVFYYDRHGNVIQQCSTNHLGGFDRDYYSYTFTGKVSSHRHVHTASGRASRVYTETYSYDFLDRLVRVTHQMDNAPAVTLFENVYDSLGRLSSRAYHGLSGDSVTYSYNIRGWLTGIHHPSFHQLLYYTDGPGVPRYNGNISSMTWQGGTETTTRGYKFTYDGLSRLKDATYGEGNAISLNANRFNEQVTGYDKMGNILGLKRYGQTSTTGYSVIDDLSLTYQGNQLKKVTDGSTGSAFNGGFEFKDGANAATEYEYDENGNLTKDLNKKITDIQYNYLNLPVLIQFEDGNRISYVYDANGTKLRTTHLIDGVTTTTDYCGNVIYENGVAKTLLTEVGYVSLVDNKYHYFVQDHQGNNRVIVDQNGAVEEVNHYYPFGGVFANSQSVQPYKYNGKELDRKGGLDWYDYGARHYDAALGRWHSIDPLVEKYYGLSPYSYCGSNSINRIDYNGCDWYQSTNQDEYIWREGHKDIDGYIRLGSSMSFQIGKDSFLNFYQNAGIKANQAVNAFDLIFSSGKLQNQLLGKNSPLSDNSKSALFNGLNSRAMDEFARPIGESLVENGVGVLIGGALGKAAGHVLRKTVAKTAKGAVMTGESFFDGAKYSTKVLSQMDKADDIFHAFPKSVDGYAAKFGQYSIKVGADGKVYQWLKLPGSYGSRSGVFEYIKDANGLINHRFFNVP